MSTMHTPHARFDALDFSKPRGFPALDGLRGVAAFAVVLFHFRSFTLGYEHFRAGEGFLAVDLFFALSGFILASAYLKRFARGMGVLEFMVNRLVRLYPLFLLGFLTGLVVALAQLRMHHVALETSGLARDASELLMLPAVGMHGQIFPINGPSWSLFFEMLVNFAFALAWRFARGIPLLLVAIASALGLLAFAIAHGTVDMGALWETAAGGAVRTICSFTLGICLFQAYAHGWLPRRLPVWSFPAACLVLVACLTIPVPDAYRVAYELAFVFLISPALLIAAIVAPVPRAAERVCTFLGLTSFALYALHYPCILVAMRILEKYKLAASAPALWAWAIGYAMLFLGIAFLADKYYDAPTRAWFDRRVKPVLARRFARRAERVA